MRLSATVALLLCVSAASATLEVYFDGSSSPHGLLNPALAFVPTLSESVDGNDTISFDDIGADGYSYTRLNPQSAPTFATPSISPAAGEWLYIWLRFNGEPQNVSILGMQLQIEPANRVAEIAWYAMDNEAFAGNGQLRWNGTYHMFHDNPGVLVSGTTAGITNRTASAVSQDSLWAGSARAALIGAVRMLPPAAGESNYVTSLSQGPLGVAYKGTIYITPAFGTAIITPEPTTVGLAIAACGFLRRNR